MTRPTLPDVSSRFGAPMGRRSCDQDPEDPTRRVYLYRLRFQDGGYDEGGAYWGSPANVYRAVSECGNLELYVRASSRADAMRAVRKSSRAFTDNPALRFYGEPA